MGNIHAIGGNCQGLAGKDKNRDDGRVCSGRLGEVPTVKVPLESILRIGHRQQSVSALDSSWSEGNQRNDDDENKQAQNYSGFQGKRRQSSHTHWLNILMYVVGLPR